MGRHIMTMIDQNPLQDGSDHDRLTDLVGMNGALSQIAAWQAQAARDGDEAPIHAMLLCLERFSAVNITFGKCVGDRVLTVAAARMLSFARAELGSHWLVARVTDNFFLIAANEPLNRERWEWLAEGLSCALDRPVEIADQRGSTQQVRLRQRFALSRSTPGEEPRRILSRLAEALEAGSAAGANHPTWVDGAVSPPGRSAAQLEADLVAALDADAIEVCYQPQFASDTGALVGAEALARWQHRELGAMGAVGLLAIAERAGLAGALSRRIYSRALADACSWPEGLRLSLNVTASDLANREFAPSLAGLLGESGFDPHRLTLEITEQALVSDLDGSATVLRSLTELGMKIALDDFGAGFCNFHYLKILPLHYLKLDRCMVEDLGRDPRDLVVLRGITAMAHALDLNVVVEGIETEEQHAIVREEGCETWQGFLGGRPMEASAFAAMAGG